MVNDGAADIVDYDDERNIIIVHKASEPLDILWKNLGTIESHFAFTRFFILLIGLVIIIFLSSPAALLARLQEVDQTNFLKFDWTDKYGTAGKYLKKSLPPLLVVTLNLVILIILDYAAVVE